jgi:predicted ribosomally synthesized peptide with nif11-like leader
MMDTLDPGRFLIVHTDRDPQQEERAMSMDSANRYLHRLLTDSKFRQEVVDVKPGDRLAMAHEAGLDFTEEELASAKASILNMTVRQMLEEEPRHQVARTALSVGAEVIQVSFYFDGTG